MGLGLGEIGLSAVSATDPAHPTGCSEPGWLLKFPELEQKGQPFLPFKGQASVQGAQEGGAFEEVSPL